MCKWCAQAKITKTSIGAKEHVWVVAFLELVAADIWQYTLTVYKYVRAFIDAATVWFAEGHVVEGVCSGYVCDSLSGLCSPSRHHIGQGYL